MSIERFFILANRAKDKDHQFSEKVCAFLQERGKICQVLYTEEERRGIRDQLRISADCLLVLGGDGTVLEAAHICAGTGTPILGINLGNLGYLAEIDSNSWKEALLCVLEGSYEIESRMMLDGSVSGPDLYMYPETYGHALNDIVVTRGSGLQILQFNVYVDGQFLNRYNADGVIISTATGSTAYNMSAGGPIVEPKARLILMTPISPHTLNNRSIILSSSDKIVIEMLPPRNGKELSAECFFDGGSGVSLKSGDRINISSSVGTTRLIRIRKQSFLQTLHRKFYSI